MKKVALVIAIILLALMTSVAQAPYTARTSVDEDGLVKWVITADFPLLNADPQCEFRNDRTKIVCILHPLILAKD